MPKKLIIWSDLYRVNYPLIDDQHKALIDLINSLYAIYLSHDTEKLPQIIKELKDYTLVHFSTEEELFKQINYPFFDDHIDKHNELIQEVNTLNELYSNAPNVLTMKTITVLQRWLTNHILNEDKKYTPYLPIV